MTDRTHEDVSFYVTTHITGQDVATVLTTGLLLLRRWYPVSPIIVIDDASPRPAGQVLADHLRLDPNLSIEQACVRGAAEGLPYLHYAANSRSPKAVMLHDSFHLLAPIDDLAGISSVRFLKHAIGEWSLCPAPDTEINRASGIQTHEDEIDDFMKRVFTSPHSFYDSYRHSRPRGKDWLVCFGAMSVISRTFLDNLITATRFDACCQSIASRRDRMILESLFPIACAYAGAPSTHEGAPLSSFGEWGGS